MRTKPEIFEVEETALERFANQGGSPGWSAAGAFVGRPIGGYGGVWAFSKIFEKQIVEMMPTEEEQAAYKAASDAGELTDVQKKEYVDGVMKAMAILIAGNAVGGSALAAAGAALVAPEGMRSRAAIGAAIGGVVPIFGAPLAALGAYIATSPKDRAANPMSTGAQLGWGAATVIVLGGLGYAAWRWEKAKVEKELDPATTT